MPGFFIYGVTVTSVYQYPGRKNDQPLEENPHIPQKNKLPHEAVHLQGIEPACAGGCLTASRKSPLEGGRFLKGATSGSLGKFVGSARRKM